MADKPTLRDVSQIVAAFAEAIPFFPRSELVHRTIASEIQRFVGSQEELAWFCHAVLTKTAKYESIAQLRALFCSRYKPDDGVSPTVDPPTGFRAEDLEAQFAEREMQENNRRLNEYRRAALSAPAEEREPFQLPAAKRIM